MSDTLPAYSLTTAGAAPQATSATLLGLPDHLLLTILSFFDFVTLHYALRPLCKRLNLFCLSLLRQAAMPLYRDHCSPLFTSASDPHAKHELLVLDLLVAALANLSKLRQETDLHILAADQLSQAYPDLFEAMQPQACLLDLLDDLLKRQPASESQLDILSDDISLIFTKRRITVQLPVKSASSSRISTIRKKIFDLPRPFDESLEHSSERIMQQLRHWSVIRYQQQGVSWYDWH